MQRRLFYLQVDIEYSYIQAKWVLSTVIFKFVEQLLITLKKSVQQRLRHKAKPLTDHSTQNSFQITGLVISSLEHCAVKDILSSNHLPQ